MHKPDSLPAALLCSFPILNIKYSTYKMADILCFLHRTLTLLLLNTTCPVLTNSVDPDQLASSEANRSGSALFVIKYVNFYQKPGSSNLIGLELEVGMASQFIQHDKG